MDWNNLHQVTAQNDKPAPGWLFREICADAERNPQDVPDVAEYLMQCVLCDNQTVSMKGCLAIRHLADEVREFRAYMQRCPEALEGLNEVAAPPQLAQAQSLERQEAKVHREAAKRALQSCLSTEPPKQAATAIKARIQGFGNYAPPEEEAPKAGAAGVVDKVAGYVGDALADTVDDFREKGAVGAVRDGIADAADLIFDGVGAVWGLLGGRRAMAAQQKTVEQERICKPRDVPLRGGVSAGGFRQGAYGLSAASTGAAAPVGFGGGSAYAPTAATSTFTGAFGRGAVGASHSFNPALLVGPQGGVSVAAAAGGYGCHGGYGDGAAATAAAAASPSAPSAAPAAAPAAPAPPKEPEDLLDLLEDDPEPAGASAPTVDLLSFDDTPANCGASVAIGAGAGASAGANGGRALQAAQLKDQGNALVRKKMFAEAVKAYEAALNALGIDPQACEGADVVGAGAAALGAVIQANIALCHYQQQLYRRAVDSATRSLALDVGNAKAYYRRCQAYKALKMYAEARRDLDALALCRHEMTLTEMQKLQNALDAASSSAAS